MFDDMSPDALIGEIEACQREESQLIARRLTAIAALLCHRTGEAEDPAADEPGYAVITGFARASAEVAAVMNLSTAIAHQMVGHAEALATRLPAVARLLAEGKVDWRTVKVIIDRTDLVGDALVSHVDQVMAERITTWQCWSRRRIINAVDTEVKIIDPEAAKERRVAADNARHISVTALPNGMARVRGALPAPAAAVFDKRLSEMATSVCGQDTRTVAQRRADAVLALGEGRELTCTCTRADCPARVAGESSNGARFVINVIASQETIAGYGNQPGYLEGYGVIDADHVRQLAETSALRQLVEPPVDDAEAMRYQPGAALERWIRCRNLMCSFPGCDRPAWRADIDHTQPFDRANPRAGGRTIPGNLDCKCREHHRLKTFHDGPDGWQNQQSPDGTVTWTSPTGRVYRIAPAGAELFPQLRRRRSPCAKPAPRRRSRRREKADRTARARAELTVLRPANAEQRRINRGRRQEVDARLWRNDVRKTLTVLKGGQRSTSPFCSWANDSLEEHITANWLPPDQPPPTPDDEPPF